MKLGNVIEAHVNSNTDTYADTDLSAGAGLKIILPRGR
jgi:hypothetical protein